MAGENKVRPKGFRAWLDNYWYYYKAHTLIGIFLLGALAVLLVQCSNRPSYDYRIVLATSTVQFVSPQLEALEKQLIQYGEDIDGDGKVTVSLVDCTVNAKDTAYDIFMSKRQRLQSILMNQSSMLLILSDKVTFEWIESVFKSGLMEDLQLSEADGHYFSLTGTCLLQNAKAGCDSTLVWPEELRISRRKVSGTLIEKDKRVIEYQKNADAFLNKLISQNS